MAENTATHASALPRVQVTRAVLGIAHMQVCAVKDATDEEILGVCNQENPSGTTSGWTRVHREGALYGPVGCKDHSDRLHIIVGC